MDNEKKEYIEGIYNYCDRWCEKCKFTSNCYLFNMESKIASYEILNKGELPEAEDLFDLEQEPGEFQEEGEEEYPEENSRSYDHEKEEAEEMEVENNPLVRLSKEYFMNASDLIKKIQDKYKFYGKREIFLDPKQEKLLENLEIFGWYHAFIGAKVSRAVNGKINLAKEDDEDQRSFEEYDMNGSAKVAVISIEKSIKSLNILYNFLPEFTAEISSLLVKTGKLQNGMDNEFPGCKDFKRPGLD